MNIVLHKLPKYQQLNQTSQHIPDSAISFVEGLPPKGLAIFNAALHWINIHPRCYVSHETIADLAGASVDYTQRILSEARKQRALDYKTRYKKTNIYSMPQFLSCPSIRQRLCSYLPALRGYLCLSMLLSAINITKTTKKVSESIIQEVTTCIFEPDKVDQMENNGVLLRNNEDLTINKSINLKLLCQRRELIDKLSQQQITSKILYPHLGDNLRFMAIQMGLTPYKSCYLSFVPDELVNSVMSQYRFVQSKETVTDKGKLIGSLLSKQLQKEGLKFDYGFVGTVASQFEMDSTWIVLTPTEKAILQNSVKHIGRKFEEKEKHQWDLHKPTSKVAVDIELQREKERIAKLRSNPYSPYYTGPIAGVDKPISSVAAIKVNPPVSAEPPKSEEMKKIEQDLIAMVLEMTGNKPPTK